MRLIQRLVRRFIPSLPYRVLTLTANGILDKTTGSFYPFRPVGSSASTTLVPARRGWHPFVYTTTVSSYNQGDHAAGATTIIATCNGVTAWMGRVVCPATVAAANVNANASSNAIMQILCDASTAVTVVMSGTGGGAILSYCYIPADPAGGPVVFEVLDEEKEDG